ncbi:alpha/beta hydrolase [Lacibacter luteus]|uniref:Alpha/beta hydrolase n=1 Tax=Lacibacter luteus TaxID=2508719 RepID=A0A4Q1CMP6_9BACT|nr:alpha/beta hydrolase [Lacibacter luteus]RXK61889.1 alpha/beta hydrolase [Lacibacter luteus]
MTHYFIVPGLGNSGADHWQTYFEQTLNNCKRIEQKEWDAPDCTDWINTIDAAINGYNSDEVVLIGHSLGCTAIAHWFAKYGRTIKAALLVAPSDIESPVYTFPATGFTPIPLNKFSFKTIVVASENDEWVLLQRAMFFAANWGSELVNIGNAGHINAVAGYGKWDDGIALVNKFE